MLVRGTGSNSVQVRRPKSIEGVAELNRERMLPWAGWLGCACANATAAATAAGATRSTESVCDDSTGLTPVGFTGVPFPGSHCSR